MLDKSLRNRPGRIISLGRLALAIVFLLAIWLDPSQPAIAPQSGYAVLGLYVALAAILLGATWNNWYLDWRLARPAHIADIAMFAIMVYLTEGYTSPFYTQFVFLVLAAAMRWSWRATALTAGIVVLLFFGVGVASLELGNGEFELQRFLFRGAYLFVLSLMLIWFGINQARRRLARVAPEEPLEAFAPRAEALADYAGRNSGAGSAALLWTDHEEPWVYCCHWHDGETHEERLPPRTLERLALKGAMTSGFIVDLDREQILAKHGRGFVTGPVPPGLATAVGEMFDGTKLIIAPIETDDFSGALILSGVAGLCASHIDLAVEIAGEIEDALSRLSHRQLAEETVVAEVRLALARDLHDSVVQILAGTAMRLESVRRRAREGADVGREIDSLQAELSLEQRDLRGLISRLRGVGGAPDTVSLINSLDWLGERLSRQWAVACSIDKVDFPDAISSEFDYQLRQIVREATANAVKHGAAEEIRIVATTDDHRLRLEIADNGCGFGVDADGKPSKPAKPKSLRERVRRLDGDLAIESSADGTRVTIRIPQVNVR